MTPTRNPRGWLCRLPSQPAFWMGMVLGGSLTTAAFELPYVNWQAIAPPIDAHPLMIRHDAKGDGHFAARRSGKRHHRGIDVVAALNTPVRAIRSGIVVQVGVHRGLGRFVELEHRRALHSLYAHLNEVTVEPGVRVRQGEVIGLVGKTGNARHPWITPHLHLEVLSHGEPMDPQRLGLRVIDPIANAPTMLATKASPLGPGTSHGADDSTESEDASGGE